MKFRLHPVLIPVFLFLMITGGFSLYALIFLSLLLHELGHLVAARITGMRVRSCTIMPYGGELVIPGRLLAPKKDRILVAMGGPIATALLLLIALSFSFPGDVMFVRIQVILLIINLLPILPLDGGQAMAAILETKGREHNTRSSVLVFSIIFLIIAILLLTTRLPTTTPYMLLTIFLLVQNIATFRFRKYEQAYLDVKLKRLTI
ncbi:M50 family metallopeptidase [Sporosarcina sp. FA9]|uniref:M50 family metallopeptidase n=1 Tax=Sporosarcina sp. FA9 TaxID=3413030 RepID=UPI003F65FB2B